MQSLKEKPEFQLENSNENKYEKKTYFRASVQNKTEKMELTIFRKTNT